jgi:integrase
MASIHRDPRGRSPFYYCAYTVGGRRVFKSTKQTNRSTAMEVCLKLERGAKRAAKGDFGEAQARKLLNEILDITGHDRMNLQTVEEFVSTWLKSKEFAKAEGTKRRYEDALQPLLRSLDSRAKISLTNLTMRDISHFVTESRNMGLSNKTINFRLKTIRAMLNSARRQGLIQTNVAYEVPLLPDTSPEKGTFELPELEALFAVSDNEWRGVILAGLTAGLRIGDAARLKWENIESVGGIPMVRLRPEKQIRTASARRRHEVPLLPDFYDYLAKLARPTDRSQPIFPTLSTRTIKGNAGLSNTFSRMIASAGIHNPPISTPSGGKGRTVYRLSFHSLKHTYISRLANAGVSRELRMKLAGHTSSAHDRYTHFEAATLVNALKDFPRVLPRLLEENSKDALNSLKPVTLVADAPPKQRKRKVHASLV